MSPAEIKWNWTKDQNSTRANQLRLKLTDGRWTNLIFNPESGAIERDNFPVNIDDVPELISELAIRSLTHQFLGYARDDGTNYMSAETAGAIAEPAFAWNLPDTYELNKARVRMSEKAYRHARRWMFWVFVVLIIWVAIVLFKTGNDIVSTDVIMPPATTILPEVPVVP